MDEGRRYRETYELFTVTLKLHDWQIRNLIRAVGGWEAAAALVGAGATEAALADSAAQVIERRGLATIALFHELAAWAPHQFDAIRSVARLYDLELSRPPPSFRTSVDEVRMAPGVVQALSLIATIALLLGSLGFVTWQGLQLAAAVAADVQYVQMVDLYGRLDGRDGAGDFRGRVHAVRALLTMFGERCPDGVQTKRPGCEQLDLTYLDLRHAETGLGARYDPTLERQDFHGGDLRDANLSDVDLSGADLSGIYALESIWASATLDGADLRCARLTCADLTNAKLRGVDLRDTDLRGADLRGADLSSATMGYTDGAPCPQKVTSCGLTGEDKIDRPALEPQHGTVWDAVVWCVHTKWPPGGKPDDVRSDPVPCDEQPGSPSL